MKIAKILSLMLLLLFSNEVMSSDLVISNVRGVNRGDVLNTPPSVIFDIKWKNAWHNDKNHDAVWIFMKFNGPWNNHVKLSATGHKILKVREGSSTPIINVSKDSLGLFLYPEPGFQGDVDMKIQLILDTINQTPSRSKLTGLSVHGLEMVYIPEGSFTLGSPDNASIKRASFYKSDGTGNPDGLISITSEDEIAVGPEKGQLYYWSERTIYNGDQKGPIPKDFPKGYNAYYIMKYELTQGQYADFLNKIPPGWTFERAPIAGLDYYNKRGGIRLEHGKYIAESPQRPMNFISFTDGLAYTDWASLRPITELEYTKAARGPSQPIPAEFVWGTNTYDRLERYVSPYGELVFANGHSESELTDVTRPILGASYYWVMDLSGSLWEKVITIGNSIGRNFKGSHGDGILNFGEATNDDWPKSDNEEGGFGYRGGGYYEVGTIYSDFNPHSPIGYRFYGAWSGGPRSIAYGYRAGRTTD